jgi:hypothetical protein
MATKEQSSIFDQETDHWDDRAAKARAALEVAMKTGTERPIGPGDRKRMFTEADQNRQTRGPDLVNVDDLPKSKSGATPKEQAEEKPKPAKSVGILTEELKK